METENLERILRDHPFFNGIKDEHLRSIVENATVERFEPGDIIVKEGDPAQTFYLIRSGNVALQQVSYRAEPFTVITLRRGDIIGWSWLFPPYRWRLTAKVLDITRAIALDGEKLRARCEEDHHLGYELMKHFAQIIDSRFDAVSEHLVEVGQHRATRIASAPV